MFFHESSFSVSIFRNIAGVQVDGGAQGHLGISLAYNCQNPFPLNAVHVALNFFILNEIITVRPQNEFGQMFLFLYVVLELAKSFRVCTLVLLIRIYFVIWSTRPLNDHKMRKAGQQSMICLTVASSTACMAY